jgi:hypothetical protein
MAEKKLLVDLLGKMTVVDSRETAVGRLVKKMTTVDGRETAVGRTVYRRNYLLYSYYRQPLRASRYGATIAGSAIAILLYTSMQA